MVNHPSFTNEASYQSLKAPILMNCAEHDDQMPPKLREQIKKMLDENQNAPAHDVRVYEKCVHGARQTVGKQGKQGKQGQQEGRAVGDQAASGTAWLESSVADTSSLAGFPAAALMDSAHGQISPSRRSRRALRRYVPGEQFGCFCCKW